MLFAHLIRLASAADLPIADKYDAYYLLNTGRRAQAAEWYLANKDVDPSTADNLSSWLQLLGEFPLLRSDAIIEQVERWIIAHPEAKDAGIALSLAQAASGYGVDDVNSPFPAAGAWCSPALAALSPLPDGGPERYAALRMRGKIEKACGISPKETEREKLEYAMSGAAGPMLRAAFGVKDGVVDEADLVALREALDEGWWSLPFLQGYAAPDLEGPSQQEAYALVIAQAHALATSDRPASVWAAISVLSTAKDKAILGIAREHLRDIDPDNESNRRMIEASQKEDEAPRSEAEEEEPELDAVTIIEPVTRFAALKQSGPPHGAWWMRISYWSARADAADAAGDADDVLLSLGHLHRMGYGGDVEQRFAKTAIETGTELSVAHRLMNRAIRWLRDPEPYSLREDPLAWREDLAEALALRATIAAAQGRTVEAADDLEEALMLERPTPERLLALGLCYADSPGQERLAAPLIASGLVSLGEGDPRAATALPVLERSLGAMDGWRTDTETYLAAFRARARVVEQAPPPTAALDVSLFADLSVTLAEGDKRLFDIEGPLVLDIWATWCGPCMQSLPHLDELARTYKGQVTFIAASVDAEHETATRYLARRGNTSFTSAWLAGGMESIGVSGIPAMFVFDAEHRLVNTLEGYGPGLRTLDEAVEAMME